MPLRTSERGAGTRQAPCRQASHISSQDASKATDSPAITRSPGPSGASCEEQPGLGVDEGGGRAVGDRDALRRAGRPGGEDDPRVVVGRRVGPARRGPAPRARRGDDGQPSPMTAATSASPKTSRGPLVRVVGVDRARTRRRRAGRPGSRRRGRSYRTGSRTPTRSPGPTPSSASSSATSVRCLRELGVGQRRRRRCRGPARHRPAPRWRERCRPGCEEPVPGPRGEESLRHRVVSR